MASQVTPPSSSPTRSDHVQPKTATPLAPQRHGWPGSSEPPPKRRRKDPSVDLTLISRRDGPSGEPQQSGPMPALRLHNAASPARPPHVKPHIRQPLADFTRLYPGAPGSTKVQPHIRQPLADFTRSYPRPSNPPAVKRHVRRPLADFTLLYRRASNPAKGRPQVAANEPRETAATGHRQNPVAASTTPQNTQSGWALGPATTPASESRPAWNDPAPSFAHTQGQQHWMNHGNFDSSSPVDPLFHHCYHGGQPVFQPQEQQWSWQQDYAYIVPAQTRPFVAHASQEVTGTADRPILLDDSPVPPVHVPAASTQTQKHQGLEGGLHFQPKPAFVEDKENTFSRLAGCGPQVTRDPETAFPNGAARDFSRPGPPVQPQETRSEPSRESQPGPARDEPNLCPEQAELVSLIEQGHNVFYTGSAGCGKSTVLKAFVRRLRDSGKKVRIIAPTGRAALNVGGSTTWTFAGWTPSSHKLPIDKIRQGAHGKNVYRRLSKTVSITVPCPRTSVFLVFKRSRMQYFRIRSRTDLILRTCWLLMRSVWWKTCISKDSTFS